MTKMITPANPESVLSETRKTLSKILAIQGITTAQKSVTSPNEVKTGIPRPWIVLSDHDVEIFIQPHPAPMPSFVLRDQDRSWTPRKSENTLVHAESSWTARYAWIPLRLLQDLGQEPLKAHYDAASGDWIFRQKFSHFDSLYGFDHLVEIRLNPIDRTYEVLEEYFRY